MQEQEKGVLSNTSQQTKLDGGRGNHKKCGSDQCSNQSVFESMVIWIGKDSKSQSNEYLEECNMHQSGE